MRCTQNHMRSFSRLVFLLLLLQFYPITPTSSRSQVKRLPGYSGDLPFKFETGYVGIGEKEETQLFYYFVESERNPDEDPIIFYFSGGPGLSGLVTFFYQLGPLKFNVDEEVENYTINLNPNTWAKMANIVFLDIPAGVGFSYAKTKEGWISSDSITVTQAKDFIKKFIIDHPKFLKNPLYIAGISYMGIIIPILTLELYNGNEHGDQPVLNIQGYILCSPLTDKFMDFNSRIEYAHRMTLISDDIYKSSLENCNGNYVNVDMANSLCARSLQRYEQCTRRINLESILDPFCGEKDSNTHCQDSDNSFNFISIWANNEVVQQALNVHEGMIGKWEQKNETISYTEGKNDTFCYSYDIFSSFQYHKELVSKNCRALIFSGDHDMTFPYVGIEQWISTLNLGIESPWEPFYIDDQVGGYEMTYAQNDFSLTFATIKGAGHSVALYKPKEAMTLTKRWLASRNYSSDS